MGQRLNIEIKSKNKVIANCYYHWSGYSLTSLKLVEDMIDGFDEVKEENELLYAIRLLGLTGAGLTREGFNYLYKNVSNFDFGEKLKSDNLLFVSRDEGRIEIDEKNMEKNRECEEFRITIDIDKKTFDFGVLFEFSKKEAEEDYPDESWEESDIKLFDILFSEIDNYVSRIAEMIENNDYNFKIGDNYYSLIR